MITPIVLKPANAGRTIGVIIHHGIIIFTVVDTVFILPAQTETAAYRFHSLPDALPERVGEDNAPSLL